MERTRNSGKTRSNDITTDDAVAGAEM